MEVGGLGILRTGRPRYPAFLPLPPRSSPPGDHLEGRLFGGGKAPERRLRVATDITVTHTRSRSRILDGISSVPNRWWPLPRRPPSVEKRKRNKAHGAAKLGAQGRASEMEKLASLVINKRFARTLITRVMERE